MFLNFLCVWGGFNVKKNPRAGKREREREKERVRERLTKQQQLYFRLKLNELLNTKGMLFNNFCFKYFFSGISKMLWAKEHENEIFAFF